MSDTEVRDDPLLAAAPLIEGYRVLGGVVVLDRIGQGGMGAVFRGHHLRLDIDVALKVLAVPYAPHDERRQVFVQRFFREARTGASVSHQNLIRVYDVNSEAGVHFIVMDYVEGETAASPLKRPSGASGGQGLEPELAVSICLGAARGLGAAHGKGIVHRDVKPDNILIGTDGSVVVADLGLAKAFADENTTDGTDLTQTQTVMGTPCYMAPEQFDGARDVGPSADVWSLGATLYHLLAGKPPWLDSSVFTLAASIKNDPLPDIKTICPGTTEELCGVLEKALSKDPEQRFANCGEFARALEGCRSSGDEGVGDRAAALSHALAESPRAEAEALSRDVIATISRSLSKPHDTPPASTVATIVEERPERPPRAPGADPEKAAPDEPPPTPPPADGEFIDLKGAQVTDQRAIGTLGGVIVVARPESIPAEDWSGCDRIVLRALRPEEDESEEGVARLREDVEALAGVGHPGLFRVLGLARHKNEEFVAIECPSGESLQSLVARREPSPDRALKVARDIAGALAELAKRGRPHRDFGPSAVFVAKDGSARVVPVACPREFRVGENVSSGGVYRGETLYAAPELHESGGLEPTERSNIFSFGVTFYQMLAFQEPFRGGTPARLLADVAGTTPRLPSSIISGLPPELDRICLRCMDKDPQRRYPGFAAVESTMRIAAESVSVGKKASSRRAESTRELPVAAPPDPQAPSSTRSTVRSSSGRRGPGGHKGVIAAAAAVAVAALGLVALVTLVGKGARQETEGLAKQIFEQADGLIKNKRYEKAWRLLDSHRETTRDVDPARFEELLRTARTSDWVQRGSVAQEEGRWEDAARAFEKALDGSPPPEDVALRSRLDESLYRVQLARAEAAERMDDWDKVARSLEEAASLGKKRGMPEYELESLREDSAFARVMAEALAARDAGDAAKERESLFRAAKLKHGDRSVMERLHSLGAGPKAVGEMLARSRKALEAGGRFKAEKFAKEASLLWPGDERPARVLTYLADRSYCELNNSVFVSATGPWESWGAAERAKAFCIDPYEFHEEGADLPRTRVSGLEAAAICRRRGGRLCRMAEWQLACSGPKRRLFPYGNKYVFDACNTAGNGPVGPGISRDCRSPFGVHDMSGNVAEWTADHVRGKGQVVAGGDWSSGESGSTCGSSIHFEPKLSSPRVGFRCCWSLPDAEDGEP